MGDTPSHGGQLVNERAVSSAASYSSPSNWLFSQCASSNLNWMKIAKTMTTHAVIENATSLLFPVHVSAGSNKASCIHWSSYQHYVSCWQPGSLAATNTSIKCTLFPLKKSPCRPFQMRTPNFSCRSSMSLFQLEVWQMFPHEIMHSIWIDAKQLFRQTLHLFKDSWRVLSFPNTHRINWEQM